jgi:agmatine deiminase
MIPDGDTNKVYFSYCSTYDFKPELKRLRTIIKQYGFTYGHIAGTKDYFCRDYMPIQLSKDEFVQFKFQPDYLLNNPELKGYVTNTTDVFKKNEFFEAKKIHHSEIILDGGNIIKSNNAVIITDKVVYDNNISGEEIKSKLEELLKVKVIIIPRYPDEETGHADGLIRFLDENTVLIINLENEEKDWSEKFLKILSENGLNVISLPKGNSPKHDWRYLNYLQIGKMVIVPEFDNGSNEIILPFLKDLFEKYRLKMETLNSEKIAEEGGVLNCFTWNILE